MVVVDNSLHMILITSKSFNFSDVDVCTQFCYHCLAAVRVQGQSLALPALRAIKMLPGSKRIFVLTPQISKVCVRSELGKYICFWGGVRSESGRTV